MNILPWEPGHIECKLYMELRYWKHRHQWYRSQAVLLCVGIDPNKIEITSDGNGFTVPDDEFGPHEFDIDWYKTKAERITNLLNQAIEVKEIEILNVPDPEDPEFYINPHVLLQWLTDNKISFPERFNKFFIPPQDKAINEAPEVSQQEEIDEFVGWEKIKPLFGRYFNISSKSGIIEFMKRHDLKFDYTISKRPKITVKKLIEWKDRLSN